MKLYSVKPFALAALLCSTLSAHATDFSIGVHPVVGAGLTVGGDTIDKAKFTDGSSQSIRAGGLLQLTGGLLFQSDNLPLAVLLSASYHVNDTNAKNGTKKFDRYPIEAIVYYTGIPKWRAGAGYRTTLSPHYTSNVEGQTGWSEDFKRPNGSLLEIGYNFAPRSWVNLRYVAEKFVPSAGAIGDMHGDITDDMGFSSYSGNHIGINVLFEF